MQRDTYSPVEEGEKKASQFVPHVARRRFDMTNWDGLWTIVCFDIAEIDRIKRDILRDRLVSLGFQYAQGSVWIHPNNYLKEVSVISTALGCKDSLLFVRARWISGSSRFIKKFDQ